MNIGIVGLGLIGGSFGRAVIKNTNHNVYGYDVNEATMLKAELLSAINYKLDEKNLCEIDLLVISVYPSQVKSVLEKFVGGLKNGAKVIDFCGIKKDIVFLMKEYSEKRKDVFFMGGHPMAGREFSGIDHSTNNLFNKASMLICPIFNDIFVESQIKNLFLEIGFEKVVVTDAKTHDKVIAYTSQMCHIISSAFIKSPTARAHFGYSAGSYKDLTRVARMSPKMWAELTLANKENLILEIDTLIDNINKYKKALQKGDEQELCELFSEGNKIKLELDVGKGKCKE